jgi:ribosomal protein S18 acetylase RimI-like enzyme
MLVTVRHSEARDADAIGYLAGEFQAYLRALGDMAKFDFGAAAYLRDGFGDDPVFAGLVAELDSAIVGYLLYHFGYDTDHGQRLVHVIDLYVTEQFRRHGIGEALIRQVAEIGRSRRAELLIWSVYRQNVIARDFYEKLGAKYLKDLDFMSLTI